MLSLYAKKNVTSNRAGKLGSQSGLGIGSFGFWIFRFMNFSPFQYYKSSGLVEFDSVWLLARHPIESKIVLISDINLLSVPKILICI